MKMNEVMRETGLTKKAIYYYETEGLISPQKDPGNNYRNYTGEDVRTLIKISILRRLDIPIKAISEIIGNSVSMKDVLKEQLILTNQKINLLVANKMIMNDLITRDIGEEDFSFETLKEFNLGVGRNTAGSGSIGKELEQIFPGTLGKTFAIFYGNCFNVPLDTVEKITAWNELIRRIDDTDEIEFPANIQRTIDEVYRERQKSGDQEVPMVREIPAGYYEDPEEGKMAEDCQQLQGLILEHIDMFAEIENYINFVNGKRGVGSTPTL